jgi:hypothetical protein
VAGPAGHRQGATGAGFGLALPVDGPPETAPNCEALIPKAKAIAGERIRTSRLQPGESQVSTPGERAGSLAQADVLGLQFGNALFSGHASMLHCCASLPDLLPLFSANWGSSLSTASAAAAI